MTKPRLWEKLHLSQWGRVKAMADHCPRLTAEAGKVIPTHKVPTIW